MSERGTTRAERSAVSRGADIEEVVLDTAAYLVVRRLGLGEVIATALDDPEPEASE
jgi:hypothetical protein